MINILKVYMYQIIIMDTLCCLYFFIQIRPLVFSFELFYIVISGPFIADYVVWALLIVEGRTVTYGC